MKKVLAVFAVLVLAYGSVASATTFSLKGVVSNAWSPGFATQLKTGGGPYPPAAGIGAPQLGIVGASIYQVDFYVSVSDLSPGHRGFGNIAWNAILPAGIINSPDLPGFQSDGHNTDTNGTSPGGGAALWSVNGDQNAADLIDIVQSINVIAAPTVTDMRAKIGLLGTTPQPRSATGVNTPQANDLGWVDGNTFLGSVYVNWNGTGQLNLIADLTGASIARSADGVLVDNTDPSTAGLITMVDGTVQFGIVPEPGTMVLMGFGGLALVGLKLRRRA